MNFFCTVATRSHLPYVRALADSLRASGNPEPLHVLVPDADATPAPATDDPANLRLHGFDLVAQELPPLIRHYFDAFELCNALKPFLVSHLFRQGAERVIYLDSDLLVVGSFAEIWNGFDQASLQLTPHHLAPPSLATKWVSEIEVVDMGFLNGGFAAWRRSTASDRMLDWLRSRLPVYGFCDRAHGMFVDQKLLPLLLEYFPDGVKVLRHPGLNIAFWNAAERDVRSAGDGRWTACGAPVLFFHLSGYRLSKPHAPCSYLPDDVNAAILRDSPWMPPVLALYHERLAARFAGHFAPPASFTHHDGVRLTPELRRLLFRTGRLDRRSREFWFIRARDTLKLVKRRVLSLLRS